MGDDLITRHIRHARVAGLSANTRTDREELLRRLDADIPGGLAGATIDDLERWLGRDPNWSAWTMATYRGHIVAFFQWHASRYNTVDPSVGLVRPRTPVGLPKPVTLGELETTINECRDPWRTYCIIAAYSGARACEIARLHRDDIDEHFVRLLGKGDKMREVPMHDEIWQVVSGKSGLIARNYYTGGPTRPNAISCGVLSALSRIGLSVSIHQFRHFFGTWALMPVELGGAGADLRTVQELMGHADPKTTMLYTQVGRAQRRLAIDGLPRVRKAPLLKVVRDDAA